MRCNFAPGKSEVVLGLFGPHARSTRSLVYTELHGKLDVQLADGPQKVVLSDAYEHLVTVLAADGKAMHEVTARIQAVWATVRPSAASFY